MGAFASIWSPSFSADFFGVKIEIGAEVGAIGYGLDINSNSFSTKGAYGWGFFLRIDW